MHKMRPVRHYSMQDIDLISDAPDLSPSHTKIAASMPYSPIPIRWLRPPGDPSTEHGRSQPLIQTGAGSMERSD